MEHYRRLLLSMVGVLSLVVSTSTPVFAVDSSALKDSTALNNKTSYESYLNKGTSTASTAPTQTVDTRMQQASALHDGWNSIMNDPSQIYYVKDGAKVSGWAKTPSWNYFDPSKGNAMLTNSWLNDSGKWYYLDCRGEMYHNIYVAGLGSFDASGAWLGYDKVDGLPTAWNGGSGMTFVDKSANTTGSISISINDFNTKVSNGLIKVRVEFGSTGGATQVSSLDWYLV